MSNGHTPGPWFVTGAMTRYVETRIEGGLIQEIAACGPTEADGGYGPQQKANACLIDAAPDLLEAAELALEVAEGWIHDQLDGTSSLASALAELDPVRAAIAKARNT